MDRSEVAYLINTKKTQDENGIWQTRETKRKVYVNVKSTSATEFHEAGRNGLNPDLVFTLFMYDYKDETLVEYKNKRYSVYRTYIIKNHGNDYIELHTERKGGVTK